MRRVEITFEDGITEIGKVDKEFSEALSRLHGLASDTQKSGLIFLRQTVPYGQNIFYRGQLMPSSETLDDAFIPKYGFPFAIVTSNVFEVFRSEHSNLNERARRQICEIVLRSGMFIGIFEALRYYLKGSQNISSDWSISAGITSIYALDEFVKTHRNSLNQAGFGAVDHESLNELGLLSRQANELGFFETPEATPWEAELLFFSNSFLELVFSDQTKCDDPHQVDAMCEAVRNVRRIISERAWPSAFQEIETNKELLEFFETTESMEFMKSLLKVVNNEKPIFNIKEEYESFCPGNEIRHGILKKIGFSEQICAPDFFSDIAHCGFIPIHQMLPLQKLYSKREYNRNNFENIIADIQSGLGHAARSTSIDVDKICGVLVNISFAVGKAGRASIYNVRIKESTRKEPKIEIVRSEDPVDFYSEVSAIRGWVDNYYPKNQRFFSQCLKIKKGE